MPNTESLFAEQRDIVMAPGYLDIICATEVTNLVATVMVKQSWCGDIGAYVAYALELF